MHDNGTRILWPADSRSRELRVVDADGTLRSLGDVDIVFPILHGPYGEDGTIQGMFELIDLPYVGNGVLASALAMDKHFTKTVLAQAGISVANGVTVHAHDYAANPASALAQAESLGYPVFVKPARAGSSVGVSKVRSAEEFAPAMATAIAEDDHVLIEAGVVGRELEIALLGGRRGEPTRASVVGEVVMSGRDFYDFEAKYLEGSGVSVEYPAKLSDAEYAEMVRIAIAAFDAIGGEGLSRVDFFLTADGFIINEINTMPGFTPFSMYPQLWAAAGVEYGDLITELIEVAYSRRG